MSRLEPIGWAAAALVLAGLPHLLSLFQTVQLTVFAIFALLALSLDFIWGIAGILSFGQAALGSADTRTASSESILERRRSHWLRECWRRSSSPADLVDLRGWSNVSCRGHLDSDADPLPTHGKHGGSEICDRRRASWRLQRDDQHTLAGPRRSRRPSFGPVEYFYVAGGLLYLALMFCVALTRSSFGRILRASGRTSRAWSCSATTSAGGSSSPLSFPRRWRASLARCSQAGGLHQPRGFQPAAGRAGGHLGAGGRTRHAWGAILGTVVVQYLTGILGGAGSTYTTIVLGSILVAIVLLFRRGLTPVTEGVAEIVRRGPNRASWASAS